MNISTPDASRRSICAGDESRYTQIQEYKKLLAAIDRKDNEVIIRILKRSQYLDSMMKLLPVPFLISNGLLEDRWDNQLLELLSINRNNYIITRYTNTSSVPFIMSLNNKWNRVYNFDIQRFEKNRTELFDGTGLNKDDFVLGEDCVRYLAQTKRGVINNDGLVLTLYSLNENFETTANVHFYKHDSCDKTVYVIKTNTIVFHIKKHLHDPYDLLYNDESMLYLCGVLVNPPSTPSQATLEEHNSLHGEIIGTPEAYFLMDYPKQFSFISPEAQLQKIHRKNSSKYLCKPKKRRFTPQREIRNCYCCKKLYDSRVCMKLYNSMCVRCGLLNYQKIVQTADLSNITAYISGGRIKIGFATVLMLLRNGARVITSTRYPMMAWYNYSQQADFKQWKDRLEIIRCDFTRMDEITSLISYLRDQKLDLLINNAAQTLKYPQDYFDRCELLETRLLEDQSRIQGAKRSTAVITQGSCASSNDTGRDSLFQLITECNTVGAPQLPIEKLVKPNPDWSQEYLEIIDRFTALKNITFDQYMDIYQERTKTDSTWYKNMEDYSLEELLQVNAINQIVPMMLINKLKPTMTKPAFIINVTAVEGQFTGVKKGEHPHTNACKSAINMIVRTMGEEKDARCANPTLFVYAIDPGFVSSANPNVNDFPITADDAAMRILDPIFQWKYGKPIQSGVKLKDYHPSAW